MRVAFAPAWQRTTSQLTWWDRPGLEVRAGRLSIAGRDAESIAREHGTPLYVHDLVRVEEQVERLQGALGGAGLRHRVRLALKAQREPAFLAFLRVARRARLAGERRDGRLLAGGDPVGPRSRVGDRRRSATPGRTCPAVTWTRSWRRACT